MQDDPEGNISAELNLDESVQKIESCNQCCKSRLVRRDKVSESRVHWLFFAYASLVILHHYNCTSNGLAASKHIITNQKHVIVYVNIIVRNIQFSIDHLTLNECAQIERPFFNFFDA